MKKASAIIQARMGATRLPGKVLLKILDKTILEYVIERVRRSKRIDNIIVATTTKDEDSEIAELVNRLGLGAYRGSEEDVLDRFYQAAKLYKTDHIVRITADCPLIDPDIIDGIVKEYFNSNADLCSNGWSRTFPDGEDVEVFKFDVLKKAWDNARLSSEREHVTPYVVNNPQDFKIVHVKNRTDLSDKRWSLDRKEDFEFIKVVLESLYPANPGFHMEDILKFLQSNPTVEDINKHHIINEGYQKSLREDKVLNIEKEEA